jgi:COMPASS component SWD3
MKIITNKFPSGSHYSPGHKSRINSVCFHKNDSTGNYSNLLVSGGWDQRVVIYDIRTNKICATIFGPYICGDSIDMKDHVLLTGSFYTDSNIELWDLRNYKLLDSLDLSKNELNVNIYAAQFSKLAGSNLIAIGSSNSNCFRLYDVDLKEREKNIGMHSYMSTRYLEKPCYTLDFAKITGLVAFSGGDGKIRIVENI